MPHTTHDSYWIGKEPLQARFPALVGPHTTDVLIIGAGISGLSTAIAIASQGRRVTVCEAEVIGAGTTGGSTGHLDAHPEMGPAKLIDRLGEDLARQYVQMRQAAILQIGEIASSACDYVQIPAYRYSEIDAEEPSLVKDFQAAQKLGLQVEWTREVPIPRARFGYKIENMARIDTAKYLRRLTEVAVAQGVTIFENTLVSGTTEKNVTSLSTSGGEVHFKQVVTAVHCNYTAALHIYAATPPYQSYVLTARVAETVPDVLFWDNSDPYYYVRRANSQENDLLLIGGCDHRTGSAQEMDSEHQLERWVRERFPIKAIEGRWSAELFEPTDGLPMIGQAFGDNMWVITGLSGVGLTLGTAAGPLIAQLINGVSTPLTEALSPSRMGLSNPLQWLREQAITASDLSERILPAKTIDPASIQPGQGAVGKVAGKHVAICQDHLGCEQRFSPVCPHMGGVVHWNEVEKTWDCPVHGGRFNARGERIYGPPESNLKPVED